MAGLGLCSVTMATTTYKQRFEVQFMLLQGAYFSLFLIASAQFSIAAPLADCDGDGFDDAEEIAMGMESDYNENGIPDACEPAAYAVVPEEFATIQLAVDGGGGRIILISEGVYEGGNTINGVIRDLRARSWAAPPVLTTGIASGVALNVNNATLRMTGVVVESSLGAIQANAGSVVVLYSCVLDDNAQAVSLMGAQLTAFDTQFTGNTGNGGGGAAINASSSQISLIQCDFVGNGGNTSMWNARSEGGAIRMTGNSGSELLASACLFSQNSATVQHDQIDSEFGASAYGGAIYATELHDTLVLDNCIFSGNRSVAALAETPAGSPAENVAEGGALYFGWVEGNVIIQQCTFKDNVVEVLRPDITAGVHVQAADVYLRGGVAANDIVFENTSFFDSEGLYRLMDGTTGSSSGLHFGHSLLR